jgi:hypothetical protein
MMIESPSWTSPKLRKATSDVDKSRSEEEESITRPLQPWLSSVIDDCTSPKRKSEPTTTTKPSWTSPQLRKTLLSVRKDDSSSADDTTTTLRLPQLSLDDDVDEEELWARELYMDA